MCFLTCNVLNLKMYYVYLYIVEYGENFILELIKKKN